MVGRLGRLGSKAFVEFSEFLKYFLSLFIKIQLLTVFLDYFQFLKKNNEKKIYEVKKFIIDYQWYPMIKLDII